MCAYENNMYEQLGVSIVHLLSSDSTVAEIPPGVRPIRRGAWVLVVDSRARGAERLRGVDGRVHGGVLLGLTALPPIRAGTRTSYARFAR